MMLKFCKKKASAYASSAYFGKLCLNLCSLAIGMQKRSLMDYGTPGSQVHQKCKQATLYKRSHMRQSDSIGEML